MQSLYPLLLVLHLFAAILFVGTVFFEVLILEKTRHHIPKRLMNAMESALSYRLVRVIPWAILTLYCCGIGMVGLRWHTALSHPFSSSFSLLLSLKILLALSVLGHFFTAMYLRRTHRLKGVINHRIHLSVFIHVIAIVAIAKLMFYIPNF